MTTSGNDETDGSGDGSRDGSREVVRHPTAAVPWRDRRRGRWATRLLVASGCVLLALSTAGWWLSTRVLDDAGFADVVAQASQRPAVRDYVADQATLRLAKSSNFVTAARPVVTDALSAAIATPPVEEAIRDFARHAHSQILHVNGVGRANISAQQAAVTIRSALQAINPALAKKLPDNVLRATVTVSQSDAVDVLLRTGSWVDDLYLPIGVLGAALLALAVWRARDRIHAVRFIGMTGATMGALLIGFGAATPLLADAASTNDPGRGDAVAAFVDVLLGRLVGAGKVFVLVGLVLVFAPGRDGGDLLGRARRARQWVTERRGVARWQLAAGAAAVVLAALVLTEPRQLLTALLVTLAVLILYVGVVWLLRGARVLSPGVETPSFHKRELLGVAAAMVAGFVLTSTVAVGLVADATTTPRANPFTGGCNGAIELCEQPLNYVVWPASHNAMSSSAYDFFGAEHTISIPEQLNSGIRFLMLDVYYGHDEDGLVRTNLAGGISRKLLAQEQGPDAVQELDRLGALTGVADTSAKDQQLYFCHDYCELGAVKAVDVLRQIRDWLDQNLNDSLVLDFEDYVKPNDLRKALAEAGLLDRVYIPAHRNSPWPTLGSLITPESGQTQRKRRVVVMSEKHGYEYPWLLPTYGVAEESPYTFTSIGQFNCNAKRGGNDKSFLIVNHWLRPDGPPDPQAAATVNSEKVLTARMQQCIVKRQRLPNVLAVDFTAVGDLYKTVNRFNAAVAKVSGVTAFTSNILRANNFTADEVHRLPAISTEDARALLGPIAGEIPMPADIAAAEAAQPLPPDAADETVIAGKQAAGKKAAAKKNAAAKKKAANAKHRQQSSKKHKKSTTTTTKVNDASDTTVAATTTTTTTTTTTEPAPPTEAPPRTEPDTNGDGVPDPTTTTDPSDAP